MGLWLYSSLWFISAPSLVLSVIIEFPVPDHWIVFNMHVFQFVLTATGTEAEQVISTQRRRFTGAQLGKVPVFYAADTLL